ncbi:MAG: DegT/DnrJ/EryC1/StrS family aminotransferase [Candidatus Woesearchaeota archaeon]
MNLTNEYKDSVKTFLREITGEKNVYIMRRGNSAILYALRSAKNFGKKTVIIPDQAGWITYEQFPERVHLETIRLKTKDGMVDPKELDSVLSDNPDCAVILNSLAGYFVELPMQEIYSVCKKHDAILINDVAGSIGTKIAKSEFCDIMVGSFGRWKPVNMGEGGFIGFNDEKYLYQKIEEFELNYNLLFDKLRNLGERQEFLRSKAAEIKKELKGFDVIFPEKEGINIIVRFKNSVERKKIIGFCEARKLPYTQCPRYIRVLDDAISIEVKRL